MADHSEINRCLRPGERVVWFLRLPLHRPRFQVTGLARDGRQNNAVGFVQGVGKTAFRTAKAAAWVAAAAMADGASGDSTAPDPNGEVHGDRPDCLAAEFAKAATGRATVVRTDQRLLVVADRTGIVGTARELGQAGLSVGRRVMSLGRDLISRGGEADRPASAVEGSAPGEGPEWSAPVDALRGVEIGPAPRTLERHRFVWHFADGSRLDHRVTAAAVGQFADQPGFFRP
ncbi:hypothetical protein [Streptoalloteichus hindustanus]|uniref:Uncharacterized protein n=1 Tax=Streptoalloteichus hindustanus TaxID=2017 RepID=A0A1M4Y1E2_STRHI|nr:hypothetical protein [Streptoalloteichus hindustanus]SHE99509.1 hypothetical protein SAMN05444320_102199 [Streptoalloteichus hindustanus]